MGNRRQMKSRGLTLGPLHDGEGKMQGKRCRKIKTLVEWNARQSQACASLMIFNCTYLKH